LTEKDGPSNLHGMKMQDMKLQGMKLAQKWQTFALYQYEFTVVNDQTKL